MNNFIIIRDHIKNTNIKPNKNYTMKDSIEIHKNKY
jgi:hypothetical protein